MTANKSAKAGAKWVERFGALEAVIARTDKNGKTYATFVIATAKFRQQGIAFGVTAAKIIDAPRGARVWAKGPLEFKTVQVDGEDKQVGDFTAIYFNAKAPKTETLRYEDVADEVLAEEARIDEEAAAEAVVAIEEPEMADLEVAAAEIAVAEVIEETALGAALRRAMQQAETA